MLSIRTHNLCVPNRNPFAGIPREISVQQARELADRNKLRHARELFAKATLVARNPTETDSIDELTTEERSELIKEEEYRWKQTWTVYITIFLNSIAAAVQGWDQTGINAGNLTFPLAFNIPTRNICMQRPSVCVCGHNGVDCTRNGW